MAWMCSADGFMKRVSAVPGASCVARANIPQPPFASAEKGIMSNEPETKVVQSAPAPLPQQQDTGPVAESPDSTLASLAIP